MSEKKCKNRIVCSTLREEMSNKETLQFTDQITRLKIGTFSLK